LEVEATYRPDSYIYDIEVKNCITSEDKCLNKYYELTTKSEKDVASYLHALSAFKRNNLLELWKNKSKTVYNLISNKNFMYSYAREFELSNKNIEKISRLVPLCDLIDNCINVLYDCYYLKRKTKALDFHFLWQIFEEIQNIRKSLIEKSKQDVEFVLIGQQYSSENSLDSKEKTNIHKYSDKLKAIWNELEEWVNSNIPQEDVDKLLEELFEEKGTKLTQKLKLITKGKIGKNVNQ